MLLQSEEILLLDKSFSAANVTTWTDPSVGSIFQVANGREEVEDWSAVLTSMQETSASGS